MKILISAYACEPTKGSEPGIGWNWALETARLGHFVWVITRENNQAAIEARLATLPPMPNLLFIYYDLPAWARRWKKGSRGVRLYYLLWQSGMFRIAKAIHSHEHFDRVQHITFGNVRQPSFLGRLNIPFAFGPVAGGERAPWRLRFGYGLKGLLLDGVRDLANVLVRVSPLMLDTFRKAERIYVTSSQTLSLLPCRYQSKAVVLLAVGSDGVSEELPTHANPGSAPRILFVGRMIYWKGMHLGLRAFAKVLSRYPEAQLTLVGNGPDEKRWRRLARRLGIDDRVEWFTWRNREELADIYRAHHALLFPSLHDSGGMVVLEAMSFGVPVVCLDLGGPGAMVDTTCGRVVSTRYVSRRRVIEKLSEAIIEVIGEPENSRALGEGALAKARMSTWSDRVKCLYCV